MGILYAFFAGKKLRRFHSRLFRPLFAVIIILLIIGDLTELSALYNAPLFPIFGGTLTLGTLVLATIGLYLWIVATELLVVIINNIISARPDADPGAVEASLIIFRYILIVLAVILVFQLIGFDSTALAAVLGGLSVGIGFALQDVLKNFLGGIILLFEGSVRPGDWVEVDNKKGVVDKLSIRNTVVRSLDNVEYIVPNQEYLSSTIVAYTYSEPSLMLKLPVGVSYNADLRKVNEVLLDVARQHPDILPLPEPIAPLLEFGESSVNFELRGWVPDVQFSGAIESGLRMMIFNAFAENGIEMPNNQLDVHFYRETKKAVEEERIENEDQV